MSIIHNALKKTQKSIIREKLSQPNESADQQVNTNQHVEKKWTTWVIISLALFLIGILGTCFIFILKQSHETPSPTASIPERHQIIEGHIVLQGIMTMSEGEVALINEEIYEVGDAINHMKIINITKDELTFQKPNGETLIMNVKTRRELAPKPAN